MQQYVGYRRDSGLWRGVGPADLWVQGLVRAGEKIEMDQENTDQHDGAGHFTLADIRAQWSTGAGKWPMSS
jgi:hypothetical protein